MSDYVDENYVDSNYVESDSTISIEELFNIISSLSLKIDSIDSRVNSCNTLSLTVLNSISNFATKDYIDSKIPTVDDISLKVIPVGSRVSVLGVTGFCTVLASRFVPHEEFTYFIVYTVSQPYNGINRVSDFANSQVVLYVPPVINPSSPQGIPNG
jgi:hypothetical protein